MSNGSGAGVGRPLCCRSSTRDTHPRGAPNSLPRRYLLRVLVAHLVLLRGSGHVTARSCVCGKQRPRSYARTSEQTRDVINKARGPTNPRRSQGRDLLAEASAPSPGPAPNTNNVAAVRYRASTRQRTRWRVTKAGRYPGVPSDTMPEAPGRSAGAA